MDTAKRPIDQCEPSNLLLDHAKKNCANYLAPLVGSQDAAKQEQKRLKNQKRRMKLKLAKQQNREQDNLAVPANGISGISITDAPNRGNNIPPQTAHSNMTARSPSSANQHSNSGGGAGSVNGSGVGYGGGAGAGGNGGRGAGADGYPAMTFSRNRNPNNQSGDARQSASIFDSYLNKGGNNRNQNSVSNNRNPNPASNRNPNPASNRNPNPASNRNPNPASNRNPNPASNRNPNPASNSFQTSPNNRNTNSASNRNNQSSANNSTQNFGNDRNANPTNYRNSNSANNGFQNQSNNSYQTEPNDRYVNPAMNRNANYPDQPAPANNRTPAPANNKTTRSGRNAKRNAGGGGGGGSGGGSGGGGAPGQPKAAPIDRNPNNIDPNVPNGDPNDPSSFESLQSLVTPLTMKAIRMFGFSTMREIQARTIPKLLMGRNLRGTAATGSGKTLAFIIPALDRLRKQGFQRHQGLGVLILSPTRELAMQIMTVLEKFLLWCSADYSHAIVMGGTNSNREATLLRQGVNILVATPGRLMDHLQNTRDFQFQNLSCLVVDEADMILSTGFEPQMKRILNILPRTRQSMLFSATRGGKVEALVTEALGRDYDEVDITVNKPNKLNANIEQEFLVCPTHHRFRKLFHLLDQHRDGKVMVFFSLCKTVKFYTALLNKLGLQAQCIHGRQSQNVRSKTFKDFQVTEKIIMLCTDVAARGWDIPKVDLILQVDPPTDASEFVHRVGRAAREVGAVGRAVLFLRPEELGYLGHLRQQHNARLRELVMEGEEAPDMQHTIHEVVRSTPELKTMAGKCARVYPRGYTQLKPTQYFGQRLPSVMEIQASYGVTPGLSPQQELSYQRTVEPLIRRVRDQC